MRCRLTISDMHINSLCDLDYSGVIITHLCQKTSHPNILSMKIMQDDGENEYIFSVANALGQLLSLWLILLQIKKGDYGN